MQLQTKKENISTLKQIIDVTSHSLTWLIYGERKIKVGECLNERKPTTLRSHENVSLINILGSSNKILIKEIGIISKLLFCRKVLLLSLLLLFVNNSIETVFSWCFALFLNN